MSRNTTQSVVEVDAINEPQIHTPECEFGKKDAKCSCPITWEGIRLAEKIVAGYKPEKGPAPHIDPAECVQRGLIEAWLGARENAEEVQLSKTIKSACGWKTTIRGRSNREFAPIEDFIYQAQTVTIGSGVVIDLMEILDTAFAPYNLSTFDDGSIEARDALYQMLSASGKSTLAKLTNPGLHGYASGQATKRLRREVISLLPTWRDAMDGLRAAWLEQGLEIISYHEGDEFAMEGPSIRC